ncbi:MAG TPA: hypothetical protein VK178_15390 [Opitutaceae bacterium]|nr:hypothetical protein [Opitutaceae bacterium]
MNTSALLHGALPHVASIIVFILACRAYLQQRSFGFLLLACGFGIGAVLAASALITHFGGPSLVVELGMSVPGLWIATLYGPALLFLFGFLLLGKGKSAAAPKSKSSSAK